MVMPFNIVESTILYAISGKHIGLAKLLRGYRLSTDDGQYISTKTDGKKFIKLKLNETVLKVHWLFAKLVYFFASKLQLSFFPTQHP